MGEKIRVFTEQRQKMNQRILQTGTLTTKRFFALDGQAYEEGALGSKTKELLGLVASTVLRCNDCITYHVLQCAQQGVTLQEFVEAFDVAMVVGGSITIPHVRHAQSVIQEIEDEIA
ncbi:MAG TPA: carboxymuconolactone decarboxylase family protein [Candidatus Polarisedimenticolia bacterium]|nr:carboxymuconolactone decarboxylase family protein [Candidatus Polarisedimenticolia bacterium]